MLSDYFLDTYFGELLAVTIQLAMAFSPFLMENQHFITFYQWRQNFTNDLCSFYSWGAYLNYSILVYQQNFVELDRLAVFHCVNVMDKQLFSLFSLELLTVDFYDYVHLSLIINRLCPGGGLSNESRFSTPCGIQGTKVVLFFFMANSFVFFFFVRLQFVG
jgi:hypothetical protein